MHGFKIENKGFKTLTDYVRVRYIPSASSKAYVGQKVKGLYWDGTSGSGQIATSCGGTWRAIKAPDSLVVLNAAQTETIHSRASEGVVYPFEGRVFLVEAISSTADDSTYAHTLYF